MTFSRQFKLLLFQGKKNIFLTNVMNLLIHKYEETPHDILQPDLNFSCQENNFIFSNLLTLMQS